MLNATARYFDQMTGINNNRCYLKLFFIRKYFENNTQQLFFVDLFINQQNAN